MDVVNTFKVGDVVAWDSPAGCWSKEKGGIVISHGTYITAWWGVVTKVEDPAPEREKLLALYREGKGNPLYGDWYNLRYTVESEGKEYCPHPITHNMRLVKRE